MIVLLIFYILVIPFCTLLHEVGHGLGVILISDRRPHIHLGHVNNSKKRSFYSGRFRFSLKWSYHGYCMWGAGLSKSQNIISLIGWPLMSLLLAFTFSILMSSAINKDLSLLLSGASRFCIIQFFITALPLKYPRWMAMYKGQPSDGLQVLNLLRDKY